MFRVSIGPYGKTCAQTRGAPGFVILCFVPCAGTFKPFDAKEHVLWSQPAAGWEPTLSTSQSSLLMRCSESASLFAGRFSCRPFVLSLLPTSDPSRLAVFYNNCSNCRTIDALPISFRVVPAVIVIQCLVQICPRRMHRC